jgi:HEAT repeat protein
VQRELAIDILAWAGDSDVSSRRLAVRALKDSEPSVRLSALRALIQLNLIDYEVIGVMVKMLGDPDDYVRRLAQDTLKQLGPKALEPLRLARTSTPLIKKIGVYYALTRIDPKFSSAGLESELSGADCRSRLEIAIALATTKHGEISQFIWDCRESSKEELELWWDALSAAVPLDCQDAFNRISS